MDIRNFFSRKRKHSDDNEEGDNPVKKKRKLTTQTIQENKKQKEEENKEESTNTNTKNDVIPSIESLEINKEHDEEKCESESESEDENQAIVIDNGSTLLKIGYAGDDAPKHIIPSISNIDDMEVHPIQRRKIINWQHMEKLWNYAIKEKLKAEASDQSILISEPVLNPMSNRKK
eukprot:123746_1